MSDITFNRPGARRPAPKVLDPLIQWATGLNTNDRRIYSGWLCEIGRSEALDDAMTDAGFQQVTIKHGSGNVVTHWAMPSLDAFVVCQGVQAIHEMHGGERYGIAFGWTSRQQNGRPQSILRARVFVRELVAVGYMEPLMLTLKGTVTGDFIGALTQQYAVLEAVDAARSRKGKPVMNPPFYAVAIPLTTGQDVTRGSNGATKEITPVVANVPNPVTDAYILERWVGKHPGLLAKIEGMLDTTVAWSVSTSAQIGIGESEGNGNSD